MALMNMSNDLGFFYFFPHPEIIKWLKQTNGIADAIIS